jgi:4-hydroxybenzoate polyprenyltransferase
MRAGRVDKPEAWPIVVDLDGSLTATDTLGESLVELLRKSPLNIPRLFLWLTKGRAGFKSAVAGKVDIAAQHLPYNEPFLAYLRSEKDNGRRIVLATAAHISIAHRVSRHLGLFEQVLATEGDRNLKGNAKLAAIRKHLGDDFVYAGNSSADLPIWKAAKAAVLIDVPPRIASTVRSSVPIEREFATKTEWKNLWARALRIHQWLKNLLLFIPLLTTFSFMDSKKLAMMTVAFFAFSLGASATYIVNDLRDLESDRAHPRKRLRPFSSAQIPILHGLLAATLCLVTAIILAALVSKTFLAMLVVYLIVTSAYSWSLKGYVLLDVTVLSLLYTLRILAGCVVAEVLVSSWLLTFSVFIFFSLALVKRCAELVTLEQIGTGSTRGRDYRVSDLTVLWPLGAATGISAVVVFGLFINTPDTQSHYATPRLLWLAGVGLVYWIGRLWIKTSRGEMDDDPVIYAVRNRGSLTTVIGIVLIMLAAHFFRLPAVP